MIERIPAIGAFILCESIACSEEIAAIIPIEQIGNLGELILLS